MQMYLTNSWCLILQSRHATVSVEAMLEALQATAAEKVYICCIN